MARRLSKSRKLDRKQPSARTARAQPSARTARAQQSARTRRSNGHAAEAALVVRAPNGHGNGSRQLPVLGRTTVPCLSCGLCCNYIAVDIEEPRTLKAATDILWYLYHPGVSIYAEGADWMVVFETRCQHQLDDHRCSIYETRPPICRAFDETECEVNSEEIGDSFYTPREFLTYLERHHKRIHTLVRKRYQAPESSLDGHAVPQTDKGPVRPRLLALRAERHRLPHTP